MSAESSVHTLPESWARSGGAGFARAARATDLLAGHSEQRHTGTGRRAKDLIGLLVSHGARIRRSARPHVVIGLTVFNPAGEAAAEISFD